MEPHENDDLAKTYQSMPPKKPMNLPSPRSTSTRLNSAGPYFQPFSLANQVGQGAPLAPLSEEAYGIYTEYFESGNQSEGVSLAPPSEDAPKNFTEYLESVNQTEEKQIYELMSPITKHTWEGEPWSGANENMGSSSTAIGHEVNNAGGFEKTLLKDLPSTMEHQSNMMLGNDPGDTNIASQHLGVDPTELDQNLGQDFNAASTNPQPEKLVSDEEEKQRKRKSSLGLPEIPKNPKQQRKRVNDLIAMNNRLKEKIERLSEECLDLSNENKILEKELAEKYGAEITDILESFDPSRFDSFAGAGAGDGGSGADADGDGGRGADGDGDGGRSADADGDGGSGRGADGDGDES
ncbi:uncharacterized protein LOC130745027 [Lotus japonicus]|uniref:uncharacterized protein LOC130745027 n=1 Tax=Lotus japonicus TaxID=34305 RepID=UPI00258BA611|nr:uncharacterized protein LOC130745027 [Lotus japonicus]